MVWSRVPQVPRDHYVEEPSTWVAACCDRGLRHSRNEDATAVASDPEPGSRAVLVVCDGVSTTPDSDVASLAAARATRDALAAGGHHRPSSAPGRAEALAAAIGAAAAQANAAILEHTDTDTVHAASCTLAAAVVERDLVVFGNVGDSRIYWIPDPGQPDEALELSLDDSMAQLRIAAGVPRTVAESGPQAHAITKWLGRDSPDVVPRTGWLTVSAAGWLLLCSDGLWNYCSTAADLQHLLARLGADARTPLSLAEALVAWACDQGGKDNVSVALARHQPAS